MAIELFPGVDGKATAYAVDDCGSVLADRDPAECAAGQAASMPSNPASRPAGVDSLSPTACLGEDERFILDAIERDQRLPAGSLALWPPARAGPGRDEQGK